jgi:hypothetical protein
MTRIATALICSLFLFVSAPAFAKDEKGAKGAAPESTVCQADFEKYCKNVKAGEGRIVACMQGNLDRLSPDCAKMMRDKASQERAVREKKAGAEKK